MSNTAFIVFDSGLEDPNNRYKEYRINDVDHLEESGFSIKLFNTEGKLVFLMPYNNVFSVTLKEVEDEPQEGQ